MNVLDLFSGIGGFSLGLERAGHRTVAFCEIDPYCRAVLAKHWPDVPIFGDICQLTGAEILANAAWHESVDVICGGFPCQDISVAGKGAGIEGERSGLWKEYARIIGEVRPKYAIVENVAALLGRGLGVVLGDLAALGYDAEWHCIPASAVGAPHRRDRLWIVAYPNSGRRGSWRECEKERDNIVAFKGGEIRLRRSIAEGLRHVNGSVWLTEPNVGRVAHGVPTRVDRLRALGNAIVPQIAEVIGWAIR